VELFPLAVDPCGVPIPPPFTSSKAKLDPEIQSGDKVIFAGFSRFKKGVEKKIL
jgi:hypothetical protein